ncbi:glucosamine--fructose-6-phosphate aminotransferase (isomerizing) [Phyllobacterium trifolii]|uniref:Glutamine--fructose-6-phosphate aminotransferase [isomerizing] n=1 Tax=Phyllobacterium trifolii TaxID=300193 RepID=A0A839UIG4_9HYPH|nr:SIS domain-containing protein [Phyllobacterium trifolii]MBB3148562.1 glucosamine--fructose-6-phosphate aminotransferase (isomerizing) [Phyllobacterium trifolii]
MSQSYVTPLLHPDSPLDAKARALVEALFEKEARLMDALPTDDPLDEKRRRRVELTRVEILGQADAIRETIRKARDETIETARHFAGLGIRRIVMTGCGDSLAVMFGVRDIFEMLLGIPVEPIQALDYAYYASRTTDPDTLVITLSSSGMTTRTVEAMLIARALGAKTLALSNTPGSALMTESDRGLMIRAERKGWPTQASTAALALLAQFALDWARAASPSDPRIDSLQAALDAVPDQLDEVTARVEAQIEAIAEREAERDFYLYAAGGPAFATAMFGAAKMKECSPDQGIAIPLEEFHHYNSLKEGDPLFLIAPDGPSVFRARDTAFEGKRWKGRIYSIVTGDQDMLDAHSDVVLRLPSVPECLSALVYCVPVQLFAHHVAMEKFRRAEKAGDERHG